MFRSTPRQGALDNTSDHLLGVLDVLQTRPEPVFPSGDGNLYLGSPAAALKSRSVADQLAAEYELVPARTAPPRAGLILPNREPPSSAIQIPDVPAFRAGFQPAHRLV